MTLEEIQAIIDQIDASDIREIDLNYQDLHLYLNKNRTTQHSASEAPVKAVTAETTETTSNVPTVTAADTTEPAKSATDPAVNEEAIKAPLVGVIYLQPSPDKPAYKQVGDTVQVGEVVCVIEAMKMMTEIKSKVAGTITSILVENEEVVEFDQPLFKVSK
jgi:acetyl-CoA carboxylase biotin carboxyl carrier protein